MLRNNTYREKKYFMINHDPLHSFKITISDWHQQYIILTSENIAHGRRLWLAFCPRWIHREFWTQYGQSHQTPETPHWAPGCNSQTRTWSICQPPLWFCYTSEQSINHSNTSVCNKSQTNIFFNLFILLYDKKIANNLRLNYFKYFYMIKYFCFSYWLMQQRFLYQLWKLNQNLFLFIPCSFTVHVQLCDPWS